MSNDIWKIFHFPFDIAIPKIVSCSCLLPPASRSGTLASSVARSPGPLEVVSTQVAGNIHYFTDEIKPGDAFDFHRLRRELPSRDTSCGDFRLFITFGSGWNDVPVIEFMCNIRKLAGCVAFK